MTSNAPADDADLIPLSALQHFLYCPRQCALIHVEQAWSENRFTAEGRVLCQRRRNFAAVCRSKSAARMQARGPPISGALLLFALHS